MNNQAPELSPEARRLINEARGADDPTADDQARVKARWLASIAAVAGVSSLTEAARAAGGIGWGLKAAGSALVIAAGMIGLNFALDADDAAMVADSARGADAAIDESARRAAAQLPGSGSSYERFQKTSPGRSEPQSLAVGAAEPRFVSQPAVSQPAVSQPAGAEPAAAEAVPVVAPNVAFAPTHAPSGEVAAPSEAEALPPAPGVSPAAAARAVVRAKPVARAASARANAARPAEKSKEAAPAAPSAVEAGPAPAATGPSGQLGEELAVLADVRTSIQAGNPVRALELLSRYEARFGEPILGMEADALRVDALCKAGDREAARESARAFQSEWPGSPLERRVSAACP